jgi:hypothetical protein
MRKIMGVLCLLATLAISLLAAPINADESAALKRTVVAPRYDVSKEVTLKGTIQNVVMRPVAGSIIGAHLMVATAQGAVDAHVGNLIFSGKDGVSFSPGQSVKLTGIMTIFNQKSVFLVRTIETGSSTITVRNDHGFLVSPGQRMRLAGVSSTGGAR